MASTTALSPSSVASKFRLRVGGVECKTVAIGGRTEKLHIRGFFTHFRLVVLKTHLLYGSAKRAYCYFHKIVLQNYIGILAADKAGQISVAHAVIGEVPEKRGRLSVEPGHRIGNRNGIVPAYHISAKLSLLRNRERHLWRGVVERAVRRHRA